jgi:transcriptional regulator with XRE-family HTH domain
MTLKEYVIEYRKSHKISQRKFAAMCDLSNGFISMLEKGDNPHTQKPITPSLPTLKKLATGMGISLDELLSVTDDIQLNLTAFDLEDSSTMESFSDKEIQLIEAYRKATPTDQQIVELALQKYMVTPCIAEAPIQAS